ncbi:MAG: DUF2752 domain-containing protein [Duncaniella sp.]|nr:DUF2752 domain-containing protein [Duncaniella sp.]
MLALAALMLLAAAAVYYALDPAGGMLPRCPFKAATGLDCPGCGAQRALHACLHGEFAAAYACNPLLAAELPLVLLVLAAELMPRRLARLRRVTASRPFILTFLAILILWTIYRNL